MTSLVYNLVGIMFKIICETKGIETTVFIGGKTECYYHMGVISRNALSLGVTVLPLCENYFLAGASVIYCREITLKDELDNFKFTKPSFLNWNRNVNSWSKEWRADQYLPGWCEDSDSSC